MTQMNRVVGVICLMVSLGAVGLTQQPSVVTGSATYRERMSLPQNAVFEATLEDVSLAGRPATIVQSFRQEHPGNPPFPFAITYDPLEIIESHIYVVRAKVSLNGRSMFESTNREQVLTQGHGSEIGVPIMMKRLSSGTGKAIAIPTGEQASCESNRVAGTRRKFYRVEGMLENRDGVVNVRAPAVHIQNLNN